MELAILILTLIGGVLIIVGNLMMVVSIILKFYI